MAHIKDQQEMKALREINLNVTSLQPLRSGEIVLLFLIKSTHCSESLRSSQLKSGCDHVEYLPITPWHGLMYLNGVPHI